jgi:chromate reductase
MTDKPKIIVFGGSARKEVSNKNLTASGAKAAIGAGADVTHIDLAHYPAPLYNGDDEEANGMPENIQNIQKLMEDTDGILISSPEYNRSLTPSLVNTLAWISSSPNKQPKYFATESKTVALMGSSPGPMGGLPAMP